MRSPALAIAWELRQRHRLALIALAGYGLVLALVRLLVLGPGTAFRLDPPNGIAAAVIVPFSTTFMYCLAVFSFGLDGDVAARRSIFPTRLLTLPVTTRALAGWPMLYGTTAVASLWLVVAPLVRWSWGLELPLIWPALLGAVYLAWTQVLAWTAYGLPGLRVVLAVAWLATLNAAVILAVQLEVPEPWLVAMLAPQLPLAYLAACAVVARARRGDVPDWREAFARIARRAHVAPRSEAFDSPRAAQAWFEWRQHGRVLPALVGILLPFELGLLYLASDEPAVLVFCTLLGVLLTPPVMAGFGAAFAGRPAQAGGDASGATLLATRPLTTAALVGAQLQAAAWSTQAAWLLVLVAVPLALVATGTWPVVAERVGQVVEVVGTPRALVFALLVLAGLVASTWKQLVQSLCIALAGRASLVRASVLVRLSLLIAVWPLADWVFGSRSVFGALWAASPWLLALLASVKMSAAAIVAERLHRSRLVSDRSLVAGAASWLAVVLALYGVLVWLVSTPPLIPRYLPALVAILGVPLVRLSAATLALAWGRHRGLPNPADPGASATPSTGRRGALRAVFVLLAVPLALVLVETVSYEVRHRNNGTLVSSGEAREYLLHVPRSYDPAKPVPLVLSLHGGAGWPALQQHVSGWNRLADSQGFIVVYPSGQGRQPRAWRVSRGAGLQRDVRFISDLIDRLRADYNIDPARIYADGLSNGGGMAFVLSCTLSDRIAAVGVVASAQLLPFDWCTDERPVPMIAFHGTADRLVPYHGGTSWVAPWPFPDVPTWTAEWARRNRCRLAPVESAAAADVTRLEYTGCADDAAVVLYTVEGGGHTWPGGGPLLEWFVGPTTRSIDATSLLWEFFGHHPRRPSPLPPGPALPSPQAGEPAPRPLT